MNASIDLSLSRREFLKSAGALVVSASMPAYVGSALAQGAAGKPALVPEELDSWVAVLPNGSVSAFFGKMDMGQCLDVAIAQIVADELDVAFERVTVFMGDTATSCNQGGASGSTGIQQGARPLRNAAAEARRILVDMASRQLGVPAERLGVKDGVIASLDDASKRVSYADLIGGKYFNAKLEWNKQIGNPMNVQGIAKP
jgi:nicotinate dehydrogenase subunit B